MTLDQRIEGLRMLSRAILTPRDAIGHEVLLGYRAQAKREGSQGTGSYGDRSRPQHREPWTLDRLAGCLMAHFSQKSWQYGP